MRLFDGSNGVALWSHDLLARPGRGRRGHNAQVDAAPVLVPTGATPLGARPPATILTSSGLVDAAHRADVGGQHECCECDEQSITIASRAPVARFFSFRTFGL